MAGGLLSTAGIRRNLNDKLQEHRFIVSQIREEQKALIEAEDSISNAEQAQKILQESAEAVQQQAHDRIASVVSRCLESVFDDPYEFKIKFEQKRGKTEASLLFVRNGLVLDDPVNQAGGGPVDIASFALRLVCLVLQKPPLRKMLVLDEPFKNIRGKEYRNRVKAMLESLSNEMGIQIILNVDHEAYPQFVLGHIIDLS